jgi:chemotaxis protein CheD
MSAMLASPPRVSVYLYAGQVFASDAPCEIATVLGSCVSVCLVDPKRGIGGANHYLLPVPVAGAGASPRFGLAAIAQLVERMLALGSARSDLHAKVFGGASLLPGGSREEEVGNLGAQNVALARRALADASIPIAAEDVGGNRGRKVVFRTDEGVVWVRKL